MMREYYSPSALALFKASPALWILRYMLDAKDEAGPAAWRGSAVEAGLDAILYGHRNLAPQKAMTSFELNAQGDMSDDVQKQRILIAPLLTQAQAACDAVTIPTATQFKIEHRVKELDLPFSGYIDYLYPEFLFDLKTTERMPSEPKPDHVMQVSIYAEATKRPARLLYVTPKKFQWFEISAEQQKSGMNEAIRLAKNIDHMLFLSKNPHALLKAMPVDFDHYRWSDSFKQQWLIATQEN